MSLYFDPAPLKHPIRRNDPDSGRAACVTGASHSRNTVGSPLMMTIIDSCADYLQRLLKNCFLFWGKKSLNCSFCCLTNSQKTSYYQSQMTNSSKSIQFRAKTNSSEKTVCHTMYIIQSLASYKKLEICHASVHHETQKTIVICLRFIYCKFANVCRGWGCYSLSKHHNGETLIITKNVLLKT